jgi:uncharacterized protein with ParB-like and HNH nuclease domain
MNYSISSDLQSRLQSLSSLVHEDKRSSDAKSSEFEEIGNIILKKIYAEILICRPVLASILSKLPPALSTISGRISKASGNEI